VGGPLGLLAAAINSPQHVSGTDGHEPTSACAAPAVKQWRRRTGKGTGICTGVAGYGGSSRGFGVVRTGGPPNGAGVQGTGQASGDGLMGCASLRGRAAAAAAPPP
jgi:hypothetical protein